MNPPPNPDDSYIVIGLLSAVFLLCLGLLLGYHFGKKYQGDIYRYVVRDMSEELRLWKHAFWDIRDTVKDHHSRLFEAPKKAPETTMDTATLSINPCHENN